MASAKTIGKGPCPSSADVPVTNLTEAGGSYISDSQSHYHLYKLLKLTLHGMPSKTTGKLQLVQSIASVISNWCSQVETYYMLWVLSLVTNRLLSAI